MLSQISPEKFTTELLKNDLGPVVEVPCSYLKDFLNYLWDSNLIRIINPANEALAMGIAAGEYLGSGKIPVVAIQNSGLMNTLNAITSLNQIYNIPAFMMVTWRGEGGVGKDAPEHDITGENLLQILKTFNLPYEIADSKNYKRQVKKLINSARKTKKPVVFIVKKNSFAKYEIKSKHRESRLEMTRYDAIKILKDQIAKKGIFVSGTGFPTRDSFNAKDTSDFYIVGSMGHAFSIALGIVPHTKKKVIVLDGDGGALMHAGGFASLEPRKNKNLIYVILDNGIYESTGGQISPSNNVNFVNLGKAFGFKAISARSKKELKKAISKLLNSNSSSFLHIQIKSGDHAGKRVSDVYSCTKITERFMSVMIK